MIATPPLARHVLGLGLAVVALVLLVVNTLVFLVLDDRLDASVDELLLERSRAVQVEAEAVARTGGDLPQLARRLESRGLRAVVRDGDGTVAAATPLSPAVGNGLPGEGGRSRSVDVDLPGDVVVEVFASTEGVSDTLRRLVVLQVVTGLAGLLLAGVLLDAALRRALRPVAQVAEAAARTAEGHLGERLRPDRPGTELGRMATAYDAMLDALERSLRDATDLSGARALLGAVVDGSTDAIVVQDLQGLILTWNDAAEQTYGWDRDRALGRHVSLVVPPEELEVLDAEVAAMVATGGGTRTYEGRRVVRGGASLPVSVRLSPVRDEAGGIVAVAAGARDITEQRWLAATLDATLDELQGAAREARASEEAARRFLADAAHQLRTPMTGIRACAETLLRGASPEDADRLLVTMVRETSRGARLVASLLRMARLDQGLPLGREPVDLVGACADEVQRLTLLAPHLEVRLDVRGAPATRVRADRAGCEEVISNLGDNALRHARGAVDVVVETSAEQVRVTVLDDGPGVPAEAREQVFERFVSLDGAGGSGLGLPIARSLARAMGGDLVYADGFVLTVPVGGATDGAGTEAAPTGS